MELARARTGGFIEYVSLPTVLLVVAACAIAALIELAVVMGWFDKGRTENQNAGARGGDGAVMLAGASGPGAAMCRTCGVVESVRPVPHATSPQQASTVAGGGPESIALLFGVLSGNVKFSPPVAYETLVRMDDGSYRAIREFSAPQWKPGEAVRILRGRIEPLPEGAELKPGEDVRVERAVPTHALCEAESDGKVLVAWKDGRHYCFRYGGSDILSASAPAG